MTDTGVRLDQWLWAARFFRTRALARAAVTGGKVRYNGHAAKPGRRVETGAEIRVQRGQEAMTVRVRDLSARRQGAPAAALLYEETAASRTAREEAALQRRAVRDSYTPPAGRPDRRNRGRIIRFQRRERS